MNFSDQSFNMEDTHIQVLNLLARLAFAAAMSYYTFSTLSNIIDPTAKKKKKAAQKARVLLQSLGVKVDFQLSEYEHLIASQLVVASSLSTSWRDVAGLQSVIKELRSTVILPIRQGGRHKSNLIKPPKGVLLHGPPGCGKTLLAKAVAKEAGCRFINLDVSALTDKWYGESQKLAAAVFTLATKLQPCIIFIDEVDSFLRVRSSGDHEATAMIKAQFLQLWDGISTDPNAHVMVMAATNRPNDVDKAILRRLPSAFYIPLPDLKGRESILQLVMREEVMAKCVDIQALARETESFSGSDLQELCRNASVYRLNNMTGADVESEGEFFNASETLPSSEDSLPPVTMKDFRQALSTMRGSRVHDHSVNELLKMDLD